MRRVLRALVCAALAASLFAFGLAAADDSSLPADIRKRLEKLSPALRSPDEAVRQAAQAELSRLRAEHVERKVQAFRDATAAADAEREARAKAEAEEWEKARAETVQVKDPYLGPCREVLAIAVAGSGKWSDELVRDCMAFEEPSLCTDLHPEANYMTPPDEEGAQHFLKKPRGDFVGVAACFNGRYGAELPVEAFWPCNSVPGLSEDERLACLSDDNRPELTFSTCGDKFDLRRDYAMWKRCTNDQYALMRIGLTIDLPRITAAVIQHELDIARRTGEREVMECTARLLEFEYSEGAAQMCVRLYRGVDFCKLTDGAEIIDRLTTVSSEWMRKAKPLMNDSIRHDDQLQYQGAALVAEAEWRQRTVRARYKHCRTR